MIRASHDQQKLWKECENLSGKGKSLSRITATMSWQTTTFSFKMFWTESTPLWWWRIIQMTRRSQTKLIHEGQYAAEVDVQLIEEEDAWSPYLSLKDAKKLDEVRQALRREDIRRASELARVFELTPVRP